MACIQYCGIKGGCPCLGLENAFHFLSAFLIYTRGGGRVCRVGRGYMMLQRVKKFYRVLPILIKLFCQIALSGFCMYSS